MVTYALIINQIINPLVPGRPDMNEAPALVGNTLSNILTLLLIVAGVAFFFMFVLGGIKWIASGGDKEKIEGAKKQISSALIGLVLILCLFAVTNLIYHLFGVNLIKFRLPRLTDKPLNLPSGCFCDEETHTWWGADCPPGLPGTTCSPSY